ncbi:MAG TPA: lipid II flippase MurJ [Nitrospira sp.]
MGLLTTTAGRGMVDGTARILLAEALFPVTALLTTAFLTRRLGPSGYGVLALTLTTIVWVETGINSFFAKTTIKFVGETRDWRPIGAMVVRLSLKAGSTTMILMWLLAGPLSALLHEQDLAFYLRLCAVDIPFFCLGQAYRNVMLGTGNYRGGAVARAGRWLARMCLVIVLVEAGFSITGALLGMIGSSVVELWVGWRYIGAGMFEKSSQAGIPMQRYGIFLFASSLCLICYNGMDLFMLKILGGTATQAGIYSSAQSLSLLPGLFSWTFSSLLLATLSRQLADGQGERARELARDAMRVTCGLIPVAAIIAGAASEIVRLVFGPDFVTAGPLLSLLIVGAVANVMLVVSLTIMTADGRVARTVVFTAPLVLLAFLSHLIFIPRFGQQGAALVTVAVSLLGAAAAVTNVSSLWRIWPPGWTFLRSLLVGLVVGGASLLWQTPGWIVLLKLIVLGLISLFSYWCVGEFRSGEMRVVRSFLLRKAESLRAA